MSQSEGHIWKLSPAQVYRDKERSISCKKCNRNTSHIFNCPHCGASKLRQVAMAVSLFFSDIINYNHSGAQCAFAVEMLFFFKSGQSVIAR